MLHCTNTNCDDFRENIDTYVPEHALSAMKSDQWEAALLKEHQSHKGKDPQDLKNAYLSIVRQWAYYGGTFFKARYVPSEAVFFKQDFEGKVRVGVNENGLHIIDPRKMVIARASSIVSYLSFHRKSRVLTSE